MRVLVLALLVSSSASAQIGAPPFPETPPSADGPPLEVRVDKSEYAVAGPAVDGTGLWVTVTERAGTDFDPCSGVAERLTGGVWVPADTLRCERPDRPARPEGAVALNQFHLAPAFLRGLVDAGGAGTFRMVYAANAAGLPLPAALRTSPPFALTDFSASHPEAVEAFGRRAGWRALAAARRSDGAYVWGYSYRYGSAPAAVNRALAECRERATHEGDTPCWVERVEPPAVSDEGAGQP